MLFFIGGRVCDVRADVGTCITLVEVPVGSFIQSFSFSLVCRSLVG